MADAKRRSANPNFGCLICLNGFAQLPSTISHPASRPVPWLPPPSVAEPRHAGPKHWASRAPPHSIAAFMDPAAPRLACNICTGSSNGVHGCNISLQASKLASSLW